MPLSQAKKTKQRKAATVDANQSAEAAAAPQRTVEVRQQERAARAVCPGRPGPAPAAHRHEWHSTFRCPAGAPTPSLLLAVGGRRHCASKYISLKQ